MFESFWAWLDARRVELGYTSYRQLELASGLSNGAIGGRRNSKLVPTAEMCIAIAPILQVPTLEVLSRAGFPIVTGPPQQPDDPDLAEAWGLLQRLSKERRALIVKVLKSLVT